MTTWVCGAQGMLGRTLAVFLDRHKIAWFGSDLEVNIADPSAVREFLGARKPRVIFNCAAYTAVDAAETDEAAATAVNATGPGVLAELAHGLGSLIVHVSTDYVFDGTLPYGQAYHEQAPTCPVSAYGRTKLLGEQGVARAFATQTNKGGWLVLRTSWLFGTGRSSFVDTMSRLMLEKDELRVVNDQVGRPTYVADLAETMLLASGLLDRPRLANGIWNFANQGAVSWHGYATTIRDEMLGLGMPVKVQKIVPVSTEEFPRPARRPMNSVLDTTRLEREGGITIRSWHAALREYLQQRQQQGSV